MRAAERATATYRPVSAPVSGRRNRKRPARVTNRAAQTSSGAWSAAGRHSTSVARRAGSVTCAAIRCASASKRSSSAALSVLFLAPSASSPRSRTPGAAAPSSTRMPGPKISWTARWYWAGVRRRKVISPAAADAADAPRSSPANRAGRRRNRRMQYLPSISHSGSSVTFSRTAGPLSAGPGPTASATTSPARVAWNAGTASSR